MARGGDWWGLSDLLENSQGFHVFPRYVPGDEPVDEELGLVAEQPLVLNGPKLLWSKSTEEGLVIQAQDRTVSLSPL